MIVCKLDLLILLTHFILHCRRNKIRWFICHLYRSSWGLCWRYSESQRGQMADRGLFPGNEDGFFRKTCLCQAWRPYQSTFSDLFSVAYDIQIFRKEAEPKIYCRNDTWYAPFNEFHRYWRTGLYTDLYKNTAHGRFARCLRLSYRLSVHIQV